MTAMPATCLADTWLAGGSALTGGLEQASAGAVDAPFAAAGAVSGPLHKTGSTLLAAFAGSLRQGSLRSLWTQGDWSIAKLQHPLPTGAADNMNSQWHILVCEPSPYLNLKYWCTYLFYHWKCHYACPKPERQNFLIG